MYDRLDESAGKLEVIEWSTTTIIRCCSPNSIVESLTVYIIRCTNCGKWSIFVRSIKRISLSGLIMKSGAWIVKKEGKKKNSIKFSSPFFILFSPRKKGESWLLGVEQSITNHNLRSENVEF